MKDLGFNAFDLIVVAMIVVGVLVGRKRGMSQELLELVLWLLIIFVGGIGYQPLARVLADPLNLGAASSCVIAYLIIAIGFFVLFVVARRYFGEKLVGSDVFGGLEYYLGMLAGGVRFLCILVFVVAMVHAPRISDQELERELRAQNRELGSIYIPPFGSIQRGIFRDSISGRLIEQYLAAQLINADPSIETRSYRESIWKRRENEVNEVIGQPRR